MKTRIVRIGNSRGVRIPKILIEQAGLSGEVEISVRDHSLVIEPARKPREGWAAALRRMAECGDDALPDDAASTSSTWDKDEWEWR